MKQIQIRFIICVMFAFSSFHFVEAQTTTGNETDSTKNANNSMVQVAYRKIPQSNLLGGVSVVNIEELTKKNYSTYSLDNMQGYVGGWNGNSLWGMDDYLVLVDGVPRDANNVSSTEIEQITFLKGASAVVLYGSRAAKGVVSISTKRGKVGDLKVNVRANQGLNVAKSYPKYLGSSEYMTLYNEARANDGMSALYSAGDIYNYGSGSNPYRYPSVDYYSSDYIKKTSNRSDLTAEISGGNDRARFYTNIGYIGVDDVFKFGEAKNNNTNRLNVRGNVDLTINHYIKAHVNANATFYNALTAKGNYWDAASTLRPNRVSPLIPISSIESNDLNSLTLINNSANLIDGKYFLAGSQVDTTNIFAAYYAAGRSKWTSRQFQFDTGIDIDLARVLKGLSFSTQFAVDYATSYTTSYDNRFAVYAPSWTNYNGKDVIGSITKYNNDIKSGVQNISGSSDKQTIEFSGQLNYVTSINDSHNFSATLVAAGYQQTQSEVYHRTSNANLGLQLSYNYENKYYVDFGAAEVHSAKLAEGHRNAFSPSLTLGWKLNKERFLAKSSVVDDLMLSVSGSVLHTDMDITSKSGDYYLYNTNYNQANGAWWGWYDGASERSTNSVRWENKNLTFIKRKEFSVNAKTSLWKSLITADASFFVNSMEGLIIQPSTIYPSYFSTGYPTASFIPYVNFNNDKRIGFDFNVNLNKHVGEVDLSLGLSGTYVKTEATRRDEYHDFAYQYRQGRSIDGIWGLQSEGFFKNAAEVASSPEQKFGGTVKPGDIKYKDQNGDNVIDEKDEIYLGQGGWNGAPLTTGVNFTVKYKNFSFFALSTGSFGAKAFKNSSYYWVYGDVKYSEVVRDRWTEDTKETATYPRLTTQSGNNNFRNSDFWLYKKDYFDLAKVQITYDFPKKMLQNFLVHEISTYISGSNLLTFSKERKLLELNTTSAPKTRFYNIGFKLMF